MILERSVRVNGSLRHQEAYIQFFHEELNRFNIRVMRISVVGMFTCFGRIMGITTSFAAPFRLSYQGREYYYVLSDPITVQVIGGNDTGTNTRYVVHQIPSDGPYHPLDNLNYLSTFSVEGHVSNLSDWNNDRYSHSTNLNWIVALYSDNGAALHDPRINHINIPNAVYAAFILPAIFDELKIPPQLKISPHTYDRKKNQINSQNLESQSDIPTPLLDLGTNLARFIGYKFYKGNIRAKYKLENLYNGNYELNLKQQLIT